MHGSCWTALPLLLASPAFAQQAAAPQLAPATAPAADEIDFSADRISYDSDAELITAEGQVRMARDGNYLAADRVSWDRKSGEVVATGNVVVLTPEGNRLVGDRVALTDSLRDGTISNLLVVLESGGRIAAERAVRSAAGTELQNATYSPCPVTSASGCPRNPSWSIRAARVTQDARTGRIRFAGGRINILGVEFPLLPIFWIGDTADKGSSGALIPDISFSNSNGLELSLPYYFRLAPNRDLTLTPHVYTKSAPGLEARYRHLNTLGAFQLGGFATYANIENPDPDDPDDSKGRGFRAYIEGNGRAQFDPYWSLTGSLRAATDKTVTRRFDLTRDDRLRNFLDLERISDDSYVSIAGWAFQGLRVDDRQKTLPIALPAIDARLRLPGTIGGGRVQFQANSLAILRIDGQDTQRAFASAQWDLRRILGTGQEVALTAFARGDVYHTDNSDETLSPLYRGTDGWHTRGIAALAADLRWPLIGAAFGGVQRLTPRVQLVLTPPTENLDIPNEDARSVDLEDSNLFSLNRFPGYDRWEDGSRITYGAEWALDRPNWSVQTVIGQSYRLTRKPSIFPDGTGLTDRFSDIVGKTRVRFGRWVDVTNRFRLDKDNFQVRRNEVDLTLGSDQTFIQAGYLRLNRDIATTEDLRDKEELRLAGRVKFATYWSLFGATVFDLTSEKEDPLSLADGWQPVRHRLGLNYEDDCLELGVSWKRDYERIGEFRKGSTFSLNISLKGLGR